MKFQDRKTSGSVAMGI